MCKKTDISEKILRHKWWAFIKGFYVPDSQHHSLGTTDLEETEY